MALLRQSGRSFELPTTLQLTVSAPKSLATIKQIDTPAPSPAVSAVGTIPASVDSIVALTAGGAVSYASSTSPPDASPTGLAGVSSAPTSGSLPTPPGQVRDSLSGRCNSRHSHRCHGRPGSFWPRLPLPAPSKQTEQSSSSDTPLDQRWTAAG